MAENQSRTETPPRPETAILPEIAISPEKGLKLVTKLLSSPPAWVSEGLKNRTLDEESSYILGTAYERDERATAALVQLKRHKPHVANPEAQLASLVQELNRLDRHAATDAVDEELIGERKDIANRENELPKTRARLQAILDFFKPTKLPFNRLTLATTDHLAKPNSGRSFDLGEEFLIASHIENRNNLDHEFMHSFINPLVERLGDRLSAVQKEKITKLAGAKLKQDYGQDWYSLLCESLIRTYNDFVKVGKRPRDLAGFEAALTNLDNRSFDDMLSAEKSLRARCSALDIHDLATMQAKAAEYFELFEMDRLRDLLFAAYEKYADKPEPKENFETFISQILTESL